MPFTQIILYPLYLECMHSYNLFLKFLMISYNISTVMFVNKYLWRKCVHYSCKKSWEISKRDCKYAFNL